MSVNVVHQLEGVQIDHHKTAGLSAAEHFQLAVHGALVQKTGQIVHGCFLIEAVEHFLSLQNVHDPLDEYLHSLDEIFQKANAAGCETIFMSPNMMNTYVADDVDPVYREVAGITAEYQNSGRMDRYIEGALNQADRDHIYICDCYTEWKAMSQTQDTTMLLANRINHPLPELHEIFADKLFATIMKNQL